MAKKLALRCKDCKQFYLRSGKCAWNHRDCHGPDCTFADECPLFTDQNGFAPLLDCDEDQLPAWYRQKELLPDECKAIPVEPVAANGVKKKSRKKKRKKQPEQLEVLSYAENVFNTASG